MNDYDPYRDIRNFVTFDPDGRITGSGSQGYGFTLDAKARGDLVAFGGTADRRQDGAELWVETGEVKPRPDLTHEFDRLTLAPGEEATISDLPPAKVTFSGPVSGTQDHPEAGDFFIGWRLPGAYRVTVEAFPCKPVTFELTVEKRA